MRTLPHSISYIFISWLVFTTNPSVTTESVKEKHYGYPARPPLSFVEHHMSDNTIASHPILVTSGEQSYAQIVMDNHKPNKIKKKPPIALVSKPVTVKPMKGQNVLGFQIVHPSGSANEVNSKPHIVLDYLPGEKPNDIEIIHSNIAVIKKTTTTKRPKRPTTPRWSIRPTFGTTTASPTSVTFPPFTVVTPTTTPEIESNPPVSHPIPLVVVTATGGTTIASIPGTTPIKRPTATTQSSTTEDDASDSSLILATESPSSAATLILPLAPSRPLGTFNLGSNSFSSLTMMSRVMRMTLGLLLVFLPTALFAVGVLTSRSGASPIFDRRSDRGGCDARCMMQMAANMEQAKREGLAHFKKHVTRFPAPTARGLDASVEKIFVGFGGG